MLINLRNALMSGKRTPYQCELEYIQSTGTQWINTGVACAFDYTYTVVAGHNELTAGSSALFGVAWAERSVFVQMGVSPRDFYWHGIKPSQYYSFTSGAMDTISFGNGFVIINGVTTTGTPYLRNNNGKTVILFGNNNYGGNGPAKVRIGRFTVTNANNEKIQDLIPVLDWSGVACMYDRVSGKLFYNAGTGDFVGGPEIHPVEYIESHGGEWIDTGIIPDDSTGVEVVHSICANNSRDNIIFGVRQDSGNTRYLSDVDWGTFDGLGWGFNTYSGNSERFALSSSDVGRVVTNSLNYMNDRAGKIDGVTYDSSLQNKTLAAISRSIYLFCANHQGTANFSGTFKVYSAKISKGQTLANKFLPVRVGTEGAMMDALTRRIYRNAGTGAFSYGNDLKYPIPAS